MELIRLELQIRKLLEFRLSGREGDIVVVEAYYAMDGSVMCRIEIFRYKRDITCRLAKYEGPMNEEFYGLAEERLALQLSEKCFKVAV